MTPQDIDNNYKHHTPSADDIQKHQLIRSKAKELAVLVNDICPMSREASLAQTHIEEAMFYANAAIARN